MGCSVPALAFSLNDKGEADKDLRPEPVTLFVGIIDFLQVRVFTSPNGIHQFSGKRYTYLAFLASRHHLSKHRLPMSFPPSKGVCHWLGVGGGGRTGYPYIKPPLPSSIRGWMNNISHLSISYLKLKENDRVFSCLVRVKTLACSSCLQSCTEQNSRLLRFCSHHFIDYITSKTSAKNPQTA